MLGGRGTVRGAPISVFALSGLARPSRKGSVFTARGTVPLRNPVTVATGRNSAFNQNEGEL